MFRIFVVPVFAWAALCITPLEAHQAQAPAATSAASTEIVVPFQPPIGRPVRYRSTIVTNQPGHEVTVWSDYELVFSSRESGFRLQVRVVDVGSPELTAVLATLSPAQREEARRMAMQTALAPFVLLLDAGGQIVELENAEAYFENAVRTSTRIVGANSEGASQETVNVAGDMIRGMSPSDRLTILTRNIGPVLDYGGSSFTIGQAVSADVPAQGIMGVFTQRVSLRAERVQDGRLFVSMRGGAGEEEMRRTIAAFVDRLLASESAQANEAGRANVQAAMRDARMEWTSAGRYEIALDTGLVDRLEATDRSLITIHGETQTIDQSLRIERVD